MKTKIPLRGKCTSAIPTCFQEFSLLLLLHVDVCRRSSLSVVWVTGCLRMIWVSGVCVESSPLKLWWGAGSSPWAGGGRSPALLNSPGSILPGCLHWRFLCCVPVMAAPRAFQARGHSVCLPRESWVLPHQCGWRSGEEEGAEVEGRAGCSWACPHGCEMGWTSPPFCHASAKLYTSESVNLIAPFCCQYHGLKFCQIKTWGAHKPGLVIMRLSEKIGSNFILFFDTLGYISCKLNLPCNCHLDCCLFRIKAVLRLGL